ncbi:hypothetical protein PBCVKS1B_134L [Paramecium bursaria Chlorella virus KS1B]|nr:hypothetical protein PBCVKS1B_134L [Paramecium bursaria Chlorella virus KS1B]
MFAKFSSMFKTLFKKFKTMCETVDTTDCECHYCRAKYMKFTPQKTDKFTHGWGMYNYCRTKDVKFTPQKTDKFTHGMGLSYF